MSSSVSEISLSIERTSLVETTAMPTLTCGGVKLLRTMYGLASVIDDVAAVVPDDYQGGYRAARHAIERGHSRIGFVTLNPLILAADLRRQGFQAAMRDAGVDVRPDWVRPGREWARQTFKCLKYREAETFAIPDPHVGRRSQLAADLDDDAGKVAAGDRVLRACHAHRESHGVGLPRDQVFGATVEPGRTNLDEYVVVADRRNRS